MATASSGEAQRKARKVMQLTSDQVLEAVHVVWLGGLGMLSKAQKEGPRLLREYIEEGERIQRRAVRAAGTAARNVRGNLQARMHEAIAKLPPVQILGEIRALRERLDAIESKIDKMAPERREERGTRSDPAR